MYRLQTTNSTAANNDLHPLLWQQFGLDIHQNPYAILKDKNENIIEVNAQHDIHIDVFYNPNQIVKSFIFNTKNEKTRQKVNSTEPSTRFSPVEFTFL
jgi:predicted nicotinamide N-methyase